MYHSFKNKKILITGHTGFKGSWLSLILHQFGAKILGISYDKYEQARLFQELNIEGDIINKHLDIRDFCSLKELVLQYNPDYIFHFAAQSLVIQGYDDPLETFQTNVIGTQNVLEAVRNLPVVPVCIIATTDKVYKNLNSGVPFFENDELGGIDPYSASKTAKEILINSYFESFLKDKGVKIGVARAGNVVGGGDWSVNRLIPDIYRSWKDGGILEIRSPHATRPWQHVLEPLFGYLDFALWLNDIATASLETMNFGPNTGEVRSVNEVCAKAKHAFPTLKVQTNESAYYEASALSLDIGKASKILNFRPVLDFSDTLEWTFQWYLGYAAGQAPSFLCKKNIEDFINVKSLV